jgi:predicted DNA-binding transcriptional regulator AlpA
MQKGFLRYPDLNSKGIKYSRQHIRRLVEVGEFPVPVEFSTHHKVWIEEEIDAYIASKIRARKFAAAKRAA